MLVARCAFIGILLIPILLLAQPVNALSGPKEYQGRQYYAVTSVNPTEDTGSKVCAKAGLKCVGYTALTTDVCQAFHPDARLTQGVDGSKSGFYCDGAPQQGKCGTEKNSCDICPACNVNADCDFVVKDLFREMYVECANDTAGAPQAIAPSYKSSFFDLIRSFLASLSSRFGSLFSRGVVVKTIQVGPYPGTWGCEFLQSPWPGVNKHLVACTAPMAADNYCKLVLTSQYAKAEVCDDNGLVVCSNPCKAPVAQQIPAACPFDASRPRGAQAQPIDWCRA